MEEFICKTNYGNRNPVDSVHNFIKFCDVDNVYIVTKYFTKRFINIISLNKRKDSKYFNGVL